MSRFPTSKEKKDSFNKEAAIDNYLGAVFGPPKGYVPLSARLAEIAEQKAAEAEKATKYPDYGRELQLTPAEQLERRRELERLSDDDLSQLLDYLRAQHQKAVGELDTIREKQQAIAAGKLSTTITIDELAELDDVSSLAGEIVERQALPSLAVLAERKVKYTRFELRAAEDVAERREADTIRAQVVKDARRLRGDLEKALKAVQKHRDFYRNLGGDPVFNAYKLVTWLERSIELIDEA